MKTVSKNKNSKILKLLLTITAVCALITLVVYFFLYKLYCAGDIGPTEITFFINSIKDIFQILIFMIVGVITILTYKQASKTLFTPIKTEIFKIQIKAFEDILTFFQSKTETDFTTLFDFDFIVNANSRLMITAYIRHFHENEITIDKEKLSELQKNFSGAIATESWANKNFFSPDYFEKVEPEKPEKITNPAIILEKWKNYEYGPINYTKKYTDASTKLNQLIASPLIPMELKNKLKEFDKLVHENLVIVGTVLNKIAQELPIKFPTANSMEKFNPSGIWNTFNHEKKHFEPVAEEILKYIRNYLKVDKLVEE
jgi:hypothetical protein